MVMLSLQTAGIYPFNKSYSNKYIFSAWYVGIWRWKWRNAQWASQCSLPFSNPKYIPKKKKGRVLEKCTFVRARIFHHLNVLSEISVKHNIPQFIVKQIFYEKKIMNKNIDYFKNKAISGFLRNLHSVGIFDDDHSVWCKVIPHCNFDVHFFNN